MMRLSEFFSNYVLLVGDSIANIGEVDSWVVGGERLPLRQGEICFSDVTIGIVLVCCCELMR